MRVQILNEKANKTNLFNIRCLRQRMFLIGSMSIVWVHTFLYV